MDSTLRLPPTIRTARPDEVPNQPNILQKIAERETAKIVEGYTFRLNENHDLPFRFFAEINIHNENLWSLFQTLLLQLPEEVCLVYHHKDDEPGFTPYADKYEILNQLRPYEIELTQDGLLAFGALYNDESFMEEVFICVPKYLRYWGMDETRFRKVMADFELIETPALKFIDEYPLATEPLSLYHPEARETGEVLRRLAAIDSK